MALSYSLASGLSTGLSRGLAGGGGGGGGGAPVDVDAAAWIAQLETDGATVTSTQSDAIHTFVDDGKTNGWYTKLINFWMPIWGLETPNRRDLKALDQALIGGTLTHAAGYLQGDGSTGYFDNPVALNTTIMSDTEQGAGALLATAITGFATEYIFGAYSGYEFRLTTGTSTASLVQDNSTISGQPVSRDNSGGIWTASITGGNQRLRLTRSAGLELDVTEAAAVGNVSSSRMGFTARHLYFDSHGDFNDHQYGAMWIDTGMTDAEEAALTAALKTCWETCTGLTLP